MVKITTLGTGGRVEASVSHICHPCCRQIQAQLVTTVFRVIKNIAKFMALSDSYHL